MPIAGDARSIVVLLLLLMIVSVLDYMAYLVWRIFSFNDRSKTKIFTTTGIVLLLTAFTNKSNEVEHQP